MLVQTLKDTADALRNRGIEVSAGKGNLVEVSRLQHLESSHGIVLPEELRRLYLTVGDGLHLGWEHGDVRGQFVVPPTAKLFKATARFRSNVTDFADDPHSLDGCVKPSHLAEAFKIWDSMRSWLPFTQENNGDGFCLRSDGSVVYDQHDWFDGFGDIATTNGLEAGNSLADFAQSWSRFFFTSPSSLWWGEFGGRSKIDWNAELFHPDFVRY